MLGVLEEELELSDVAGVLFDALSDVDEESDPLSDPFEDSDELLLCSPFSPFSLLSLPLS